MHDAPDVAAGPRDDAPANDLASCPVDRPKRVRRGVWIFPAVPAGELVDAVVAAEELGLDEVWIADEGVMREPMVVLAAAAARTARIRLATGITSPYLRHPGAIASSLATLDELSGGRAVLGLGVGGHLSLDPFGIVAERPVARLREAITLARGVLDGRPVDGYTPPDHAMPARPVPIWVGARGPQLVRTAARFADGLFLSGCTPDEHDRIVADAAGGSHYALYQSADDAPANPTEQTWDAASDYLATEAARLRPAAVGLSLVGLARTNHPGAVALVERAAAALLEV